MTLEKTQKVLALIYTDKQYRENFFSDNAKAVDYDLSEAELENLKSISLKQVNFFADSLQYKRLHQAYKFLPIVHKVLGKDFIPLFMEYAGTYAPAGIKKYLEDAEHFAFYLKANELKLKYPWIGDLAYYEIALLKVSNPELKLYICQFRYPVTEIILQINKGEKIKAVKKKTIIFWYRFRKNGKLQQVVL
jgi:hypothetical protein